MKAFVWKLKAYWYMSKRVGWSSWEIVSACHETFGDWSPEEAIEEELSYWGD